MATYLLFRNISAVKLVYLLCLFLADSFEGKLEWDFQSVRKNTNESYSRPLGGLCPVNLSNKFVLFFLFFSSGAVGDNDLQNHHPGIFSAFVFSVWVALRPSQLALRPYQLALRASQLVLRLSQLALRAFQLALRPSWILGLPNWP